MIRNRHNIAEYKVFYSVCIIISNEFIKLDIFLHYISDNNIMLPFGIVCLIAISAVSGSKTKPIFNDPVLVIFV